MLLELESIVFSGTKLDIDYYVDDILDEDQQEELHEYFLESESEDISIALEEFEGDYDEEELRSGKGKILLMTDNTNFRAFWFGTNRIILNMLFHSNIM